MDIGQRVSWLFYRNFAAESHLKLWHSFNTYQTATHSIPPAMQPAMMAGYGIVVEDIRSLNRI